MYFEAVVEPLYSSIDVVERKFAFNIHKSVCGVQRLHKRPAQSMGLSHFEAYRMNAVRFFGAFLCKSMIYVFLQPKIAERMQKERQVLR